jgi:hypothetical protein
MSSADLVKRPCGEVKKREEVTNPMLEGGNRE